MIGDLANVLSLNCVVHSQTQPAHVKLAVGSPHY